MKNIIALLALLTALTLTASAQTTTTTNASGGTSTVSNPIADNPLTAPISNTALASTINTLENAGKTIESVLSANTNAVKATDWTFFASYSKASGSLHNSGMSAGGVYYVNQYVGTQIRAQYLDVGKGGGLNAILLPNAAVTLSSTYQPFGSGFPLTIRPLVESGAAVNLKGDAYAILGAGTEVDFYSTTNTAAVLQRISGFYGIEQWSGPEKFTLTQIGFAANFNLEKVIADVEGWFKKSPATTTTAAPAPAATP